MGWGGGWWWVSGSRTHTVRPRGNSLGIYHLSPVCEGVWGLAAFLGAEAVQEIAG